MIVKESRWMDPIKVNFDRLIKALESRAHRDFDQYYFDRKTGDVLSADGLAKESPAKLRLVEDDSKRYLLIKGLEGQDIGDLMESFFKTIEHCEEREYLEDALLNADFVSYKDILAENENLNQKWMEFHKSYMDDVAEWWLDQHGIVGHKK